MSTSLNLPNGEVSEPGAGRATIATVARPPGSLQSMVRWLLGVSPMDIGRQQYLERIAETADALESWLGANTGTNDDWPIKIKADEAGAAKLSALLSDLDGALMVYRRERAKPPNAPSSPTP